MAKKENLEIRLDEHDEPPFSPVLEAPEDAEGEETGRSTDEAQGDFSEFLRDDQEVEFEEHLDTDPPLASCSHMIPKGRYQIDAGAVIWTLGRCENGDFITRIPAQTISTLEGDFNPRIADISVVGIPDEFGGWVVLRETDSFILVKASELTALIG